MHECEIRMTPAIMQYHIIKNCGKLGALVLIILILVRLSEIIIKILETYNNN